MPIVLLALILLLLAPASAMGALPAPVLIDSDRIELGRHMVYQEDPHAQKTPQTLDNLRWLPIDHNVPTFGYTTSQFWFRFNLKNNSPVATQRLIEVAYPVLDQLEVWVATEEGQIVHYQLGDKYPFAQRPYPHRNFVIPIALGPQQQTSILFRIASTSAIQVPTVLWAYPRFHEQDQLSSTLLGIYYGTVLCMLIYNLFLFARLRERSGGYYLIWVSGMLLFMASLNGTAFQYLWPNATQWNDLAIAFFLAMAVMFASQFAIEFLDLKKQPGKFSRWLSHLTVAIGFSAVLSCFLFTYAYSIRYVITIAIGTIAINFGIAFLRMNQGYKPARFYIAAWTCVMLGGTILALNKFGLIERNLFTEHATQIGSGIEVILLSFGLADRIITERRLREAAQRDALHLQLQANSILEVRVAERTQALKEANRRLQAISLTDPLTGLRNRRYFDEKIEREAVRAKRNTAPLSLLMIDIDHFKRVNDQYGHPAGDVVLRQVASTLKSCLKRETDVAARFGGEEFCILLPNTPHEGALHVAEIIRQTIEQNRINLPDGQPINLTVSIGLSTLPPALFDRTDLLLQVADTALYQAKSDGRNRVVFRPVAESI